MRWQGGPIRHVLQNLDADAKEALYYQLQEAEFRYALEHRIYQDLGNGNKTEKGIAKRLTRHRMRSRLSKGRVIGN